jgi:hypothetical protein
MPQRQSSFKVTIIVRKGAKPLVIPYTTEKEARSAASGFRSTLPPNEGGSVTVHDRDGKELARYSAGS